MIVITALGNRQLLVWFCVCQLAGTAGSTAAAGDKGSEERTRSALIAWLGSQYVDRTELETRLVALARDVSDDLNSKIDKAAMLAAAAAGMSWCYLNDDLIRWTHSVLLLGSDYSVTNVSAVTVTSASSVDSDRSKADDVASSDSDHSGGDTVGIIGAGVTAQRNCTLCAGAITQEVDGSCLLKYCI